MKTILHGKSSENHPTGIRLLLALSLFLITLDTYSQTWGLLNSGITDQVNGICFSKQNKSTGYAVASGGRILKTADGGLTWSLKNSGTVKNLFAVCFMGQDTGFAVGDSGTVLMTTNSGNQWDTISCPTNERLNNIHLSGNKGFIVGNNGTLLLLNANGITSLSSNTTQNLYGTFVLDDQTAFATGGSTANPVLLATYNGGNVWVPLSTGGVMQLNDVFFTNDSVGFVIGNNGTAMKTINSGATWNSLTTGTPSNLKAIYFINKDTGYAAGAGGVVARTHNGGSSWTTTVTGITIAINDIIFTDDFTGYSAGGSGTIIKTCPTARVEVSPNDSICVHTFTSFFNQSGNANSYVWLNNTDTVSTGIHYSNTFDTVGTWTMKLVADNGTCKSSVTVQVVVEDTPMVDLGPDTTICTTCTIQLDAGNPGSTYIWYKDGVATGIVARRNTVGVAGVYSVKVTTPGGCIAYDSVEVKMATGVADLNGERGAIFVYPNPGNKQFMVNLNMSEPVDLIITNSLGKVIYQTRIKSPGRHEQPVSLEEFPAGVYFINLSGTAQSSKGIKLISY